jgi:hypothetical protein
MFRYLWLILLLLTACSSSQQDKDRIGQLEKQTKELENQTNGLDKQTKELQQQIKMQQGIASLDAQSKCAAAAKTYFKENWSNNSTNENTRLLNYTNHYSSRLNKCFIRIEYNFIVGEQDGGPWTNTITLVDAFEGAKFGWFAENHTMTLQPKDEERNRLSLCKVAYTKCKNLEEFNKLSQSYMQN